MASRLARLERLERDLLRKVPPALPGCIVVGVGPDGEPASLDLIRELSAVWPLTVVREWHREPGEDEDQFADRVQAAAGPGALLVAG